MSKTTKSKKEVSENTEETTAAMPTEHTAEQDAKQAKPRVLNKTCPKCGYDKLKKTAHGKIVCPYCGADLTNKFKEE
jgi:uncharacterized protein (DUF983 family)